VTRRTGHAPRRGRREVSLPVESAGLGAGHAPAWPGSLTLPAPDGFSFARTVISHGWCALPPFHLDRGTMVLARVLRMPSGRIIAVDLDGDRGQGADPAGSGRDGSRARIRARWKAAPLSPSDRESLRAQIARMLRLDEDLAPFYGLAARKRGYEWIPRAGAGRLLRSPTVFEDLVKLVCTTNCTWSLTESIVGRLVESLGEPAEAPGRRSTRLRTSASGKGVDFVRSDAAPESLRAFPTPEAMAACGERFFASEIRAGYRSRALAELSGRVASGELDTESWVDPALPVEELSRRILSVRGAGRYTLENLLKLLGRYEGLGLDSWSRAKFARIHPRAGSVREGAESGPAARSREVRAGSSARDSGAGARAAGRLPTDGEIALWYRGFGPWRGLALWCDVTRDWLSGENPSGGTGDKF
jgi:3-methyladenine DNA glycosylase/8-oxoguanine DNA glycosylase